LRLRAVAGSALGGTVVLHWHKNPSGRLQTDFLGGNVSRMVPWLVQVSPRNMHGERRM